MRRRPRARGWRAGRRSCGGRRISSTGRRSGESFDRLAELVRDVGRGRPRAATAPPPARSACSPATCTTPTSRGARLPAATGPPVYQLTCSPVHNYVPPAMKVAFRVGWSRAAERSVRTLIGTIARIPRPPIRWHRIAGPLFGNDVMSLTLDGPRADLRLDQAGPARGPGRAARDRPDAVGIGRHRTRASGSSPPRSCSCRSRAPGHRRTVVRRVLGQFVRDRFLRRRRAPWRCVTRPGEPWSAGPSRNVWPRAHHRDHPGGDAGRRRRAAGLPQPQATDRLDRGDRRRIDRFVRRRPYLQPHRRGRPADPALRSDRLDHRGDRGRRRLQVGHRTCPRGPPMPRRFRGNVPERFAETGPGGDTVDGCSSTWT